MFLRLLSDTDEGKKLEKTYSVKGHPSFVLTNPSGDVLDRWVGFRNPESWLTIMSSAVADPTTFEQKRTRFATSPTAKDAATLGRIHGTRGERADALTHYRRALELDPAGPYAQPIFDQVAALHGEKDSGVTTDDVTKAAKAALASSHATPESKVGLALGMLRVGTRAKDMKLVAPYLEAALDATKDSTAEDMIKMRDRLLIEEALHVKGDPAKAVELKRKSMPEGWMTQPAQLNAFAWWSFENRVNLAEAETLARKGVELSGPGAERAQILDTVAELCNLRGECPEAITLIRQAMKEDPDEEHYPKQLARFEKVLAGKS